MVLPLPLKDDNPTRTKPVVTWAVIAACIYVFAFVQPHNDANRETEFVVEHAAIPCEITHGRPISNSLSAQEHLDVDRGCDVPARILGSRSRQHAVPVDLRQQRRRPLRKSALHPFL